MTHVRNFQIAGPAMVRDHVARIAASERGALTDLSFLMCSTYGISANIGPNKEPEVEVNTPYMAYVGLWWCQMPYQRYRIIVLRNTETHLDSL